MSLVGYEYSDDDDESDELAAEEEQKPSTTATSAAHHNVVDGVSGGKTKLDDGDSNSDSKVTVEDVAVEEKPNSSINTMTKPSPYFQSITSILKNDTVKRTSTGRVQINIPSLELLKQDDSSSEDEEERERKRFKKSDQGSRLLSLLPKPQNSLKSTLGAGTGDAVQPKVSSLTSLVPNSVTNRTKDKQHEAKDRQHSKDEILSGESNFFFDSYNNDNDDDDDDDNDNDGLNIHFDTSAHQRDSLMASTSAAPFVSDQSAPMYGPAKPDPVNNVLVAEPLDPNSDITYKKFIASKFGDEPTADMKILDVDVNKHMSQNQEWLRNITLEKGVDDEQIEGSAPNSTARRKNQITYLAYQAKKREVELKNQWAQNKITKSQTRAKYGF